MQIIKCNKLVMQILYGRTDVRCSDEMLLVIHTKIGYWRVERVWKKTVVNKQIRQGIVIKVGPLLIKNTSTGEGYC